MTPLHLAPCPTCSAAGRPHQVFIQAFHLSSTGDCVACDYRCITCGIGEGLNVTTRPNYRGGPPTTDAPPKSQTRPR